MSIEVKIEGVQRVRDNIGRFQKASKDEIFRSFKTIVKKIVMDAKKNAPVDTGELRLSLDGNVKILSNEIHGRVFSNTEYAKWQEFGTSRGIKPKRFLTRAVISNTRNIPPELREAIQRSIVRAL